MKRLNDCIYDKYDSYILPFFWQHGDSHEMLKAEIDAIQRSGAREFCVESRVHEEFCRDKWWEDFGFILEEAKRRNMYVWLLDDKRCPTGYANGAMAKYPHLRKRHIQNYFIDVAGPKKEAAVYLPQIDTNNEKLVNVVAYKRSECDEQLVEGEPLSLMQNVEEGLVYFDIPKGAYRVFFTVETTLQKFNEWMHLVDMINPESASLMLSQVYEPHYEHFKEYFGETFKGFFSDEPCFGNDGYSAEAVLGKQDMLLPISEELIQMLCEKCSDTRQEILDLLPLLWQKHTQKNHKIRYCYMDAVTLLYKKHFSDLVGSWCRDHSVMYIGHIIEDANCHMRLGVGAGHFFRAMSGQDMSGCDIVLNQMIPGINDLVHAAPVSAKTVNPEFFRYTLAKLAVSDAHLDPKKKGRALCEIFGAFGWAEGVPMMKNLADHMLVSGINHFVPHAFSNRYPNPDCPPHFYCGGKNPQFDAYCCLTKYMQRMCHMFYGAKHVNNVAVFYNAEAEWCAGEYDLFQKISKILLQNQIDFDYVSADHLDNANISDGEFTINGECFKTIVVSFSTVLPKHIIEKLNLLSRCGVEVIFCEGLPEKYADSQDEVVCNKFTVTKNEQLPAALKNYRDITLSKECKYLRYYHVNNDGTDVYMFSNENAFEEIDVDVKLRHGTEYIRYNAWDNSTRYGKTNDNVLTLKLSPSESCVFVFEQHGNKTCDTYKKYTSSKVNTEWKISIFSEKGYEIFDTTDKLYNIARKLPEFAGKIKYETTLKLDKIPEKITLGNVGEIASLTINGFKCTDALFVPYAFDISDKCVLGENKIEIEVITSLGYRDRDRYSKYLSLAPMGMIGPVELKF